MLRRMASATRKVVAVGETGLDDYWKTVPIEIQADVFKAHLKLARALDFPVVIHCRDAEVEMERVLWDEYAKNGPIRGVIHSFSSGEGFLKRSLEVGLHISYSGSVTYKNRKYDALRQTVALVPENRLLLETDAPYLIPTQARKMTHVNHPWLARFTAEVLAELRGVTFEEILRLTTKNAGDLFRS